MKPRIGVITRYNDKERKYFSNASYVHAVSDAGGIPVQLPLVDKEDADRLIESVDGLMLTGGPDVTPILYGEEPCNKMGACNRHNDEMEIALLMAAVAAKKPVLGICRGLQVINVAYGGTLYQDIPSQVPNSIMHLQPSGREEETHSVAITPGSYAYEVHKSEKIYVNSFHHQGIKDLAEGFKITGMAPDGIPEAIENDDASIFAVQWHPEEMYDVYPEHSLIFKTFIDRCK